MDAPALFRRANAGLHDQHSPWLRLHSQRMRFRFEKYNHNDHNAASGATQLSFNAAGANYVVAEQQFPARAAGLRSSDFDLHTAGSEWLE